MCCRGRWCPFLSHISSENWVTSFLLNLLCVYDTFCYLALLQGLYRCLWSLHLCRFVSGPWMCGVCVFLNATSLSKMALYYPDRRTLASYCADHGKTPFSVESLLIKVPFSLITSQLVEVAGCASFPSCSYEDSLSSLIMRRVKSRMSQSNRWTSVFLSMLKNKQGKKSRKHVCPELSPVSHRQNENEKRAQSKVMQCKSLYTLSY